MFTQDEVDLEALRYVVVLLYSAGAVFGYLFLEKLWEYWKARTRKEKGDG